MSDVKGGKPVYLAKARQTADSEFLIVIGAVWPFKNGDGFVVKLHSVPTDWRGDMILVKPQPNE
jgi:hypothetical protein